MSRRTSILSNREVAYVDKKQGWSPKGETEKINSGRTKKRNKKGKNQRWNIFFKARGETLLIKTNYMRRHRRNGTQIMSPMIQAGMQEGMVRAEELALEEHYRRQARPVAFSKARRQSLWACPFSLGPVGSDGLHSIFGVPTSGRNLSRPVAKAGHQVIPNEAIKWAMSTGSLKWTRASFASPALVWR